MNDTAKQIIVDKLKKAMLMEGLTAKETANILRIPSCNISMMKNPKFWGKCAKTSWIITQKWTNLGIRLREFTEHANHCWNEIKAADKELIKVKESTFITETEPNIQHDVTSKVVVDGTKVSIDIEINLYINGKKIEL